MVGETQNDVAELATIRNVSPGFPKSCDFGYQATQLRQMARLLLVPFESTARK